MKFTTGIMYVEPLTLICAASWLSSYAALFINADRFVIEPCLTKSLTHAPSRPTTSAIVPAAAPAMVCSLVEANGPDRSLTLIPGLAASNWSIRPRRAPWGNSGSHHCENSSVATPPEPPPGFAAPAGLLEGPTQPATSTTRTATSEVARQVAVAATPFLMCTLPCTVVLLRAVLSQEVRVSA